MKRNWIDEFKAGFAFIEILLILVIILFLYYIALNLYFQRTPLNKETGKTLSEQGIDTTDYTTIKDSLRKKIEDIQKKRTDELRNIQ